MDAKKTTSSEYERASGLGIAAHLDGTNTAGAQNIDYTDNNPATMVFRRRIMRTKGCSSFVVHARRSCGDEGFEAGFVHGNPSQNIYNPFQKRTTTLDLKFSGLVIFRLEIKTSHPLKLFPLRFS